MSKFTAPMFLVKLSCSVATALFISGCGTGEMPGAGIPTRTPAPSSPAGADATSETTFDLSKCGFDLSKPGVNFGSRRMSMTPMPKAVIVPIPIPIFGGILTRTENIVIDGIGIMEDSLSRSVSTFSGSANPVVDSEEVKPIIAKLTSGFAADILAPAARAKIGQTNPDWKGVFCSYQPAIKLERGSTEKITVDLDKPLPISPVVVAGLDRLKSELGTKRIWKGITAKVSSSTDPNVVVGTVWTGGVTSESVAATTTVDGTTGKVTIQSELAVKLTYDFGSIEANKALGLPKSAVWYIDTATKGYKLMQVDFGDGVPVNYFPSL
jgi:hypothetical protein